MTLDNFNELENIFGYDCLDNLLIGNGFSISIDNSFQYSTLFEVCKEYISENDIKLFNELDSYNFEKILEGIDIAIKINKNFNIHTEVLQNSYESIKRGLINAINDIHINYQDLTGPQEKYFITSSRLFDMVRKNIYSTNYDLIPYWIWMKVTREFPNPENHEMTDFFRRRDKSFLHFSEGKPSGKSLFFLHGALHLYNENGYIKKIQSENSVLLDRITNAINNEGIVPLFVSEGNWERKLAKIFSNRYLNFCYNQLQNSNGSLTIFGSSLGEYDNHIVEAIQKSEINPIAYGIYTKNMSEASVKRIMSEIREKLETKEVYFFNSNTFYKSINRLWDDRNGGWGGEWPF